MGQLTKPTQTTYWIAYSNDNTILHHGITEPNQETITGQPNFEYNTDKQTILDRVIELGFESISFDTES